MGAPPQPLLHPDLDVDTLQVDLTLRERKLFTYGGQFAPAFRNGVPTNSS